MAPIGVTVSDLTSFGAVTIAAVALAANALLSIRGVSPIAFLALAQAM